jgi:hypothetical protein
LYSAFNEVHNEELTNNSEISHIKGIVKNGLSFPEIIICSDKISEDLINKAKQKFKEEPSINIQLFELMYLISILQTTLTFLLQAN